MTWAFEQTLKPAHKLVLLALADFADEHQNCWPGQQTIAEKASVSERTLRRILSELEDDGYIKRARRNTQTGFRTSDSYHLEILPAESAGRTPPTGQKSAPTGQLRTTNRPTVAGTGEPSVEPSVKESLSAPNGFDEFWQVFPRKVYINNARREWDALMKAGEDPERIIRAAVRYDTEVRQQQTEERFIKAPAAWLGGGGWMNYDAPAPQPVRLDSDRSPDEIAAERAAFLEKHKDDEPLWKQRQRMLQDLPPITDPEG